MNQTKEMEEAFNLFFANPIIQNQPLPFSEERIRNEPNDAIKRAMNFIDSLFGMKLVGEPYEEEDKILLEKSLAILSYMKKIDTSQGIAIIKQLFQDD